jgi:hypothetical protein
VKLPNREIAYIPSGKLGGYLLSKTHVVGRWKATFFGALGFDETNADVLQEGLMVIAHSQEVKEVVASPYGTKYIMDGLLETPVGGQVAVRTVWIVEEGDDRPRFVTAYPAIPAWKEVENDS